MEKALWTAVGVLGMGLHTAARAEDLSPPPHPRPMIISVAAPLMPLPVPAQAFTRVLERSPIVEPTEAGHAEMAGAAIVGFAALWAARRKRIV